MATDSEGDAVFFRIISAENGSASFTPDGKSVLFSNHDDYYGAATILNKEAVLTEDSPSGSD